MLKRNCSAQAALIYILLALVHALLSSIVNAAPLQSWVSPSRWKPPIYGANQSRLTLWNFQSESATGLKTSNTIHHLRGRLKNTWSNMRGAVVTALQMLSWHSILVPIVENFMMKPKNVPLFAISRVEICLKVTVQSSSTIHVLTAAQQNTLPTCAM